MISQRQLFWLSHVAKVGLLTCAFFIFSLLYCFGQTTLLIEGGTTNTLNGVSSNFNYCYVGSNTVNNCLIITNGGSLNTSSGYVGYTASAMYNRAVIDGAGSAWLSSNVIMIGQNGKSNQVVVTNGGYLVTRSMNLGSGSGADYNSFIVSGPGSYLNVTGGTYGEFAMSFNGSYNTTRIENGGRITVTGAAGIIRIGYNDGHDELFVVNGTNSLFQVASIFIGWKRNNNTLVVENGGRVVASWRMYLGENAQYGYSNRASVSGLGSTLTVSNEFVVGDLGQWNSLVVSNAGYVYSSNGIIGNTASSTGNAITVTGAGSLWTNKHNIYVGYNGPRNQFRIENNGAAYCMTGIIGNASTATGNMVTVSGTGSTWNCQCLIVANEGAGNMAISDGGRVIISSNITIGTSGYVTNYVQGSSGGLDLSATGGGLSVNGQIHIIFQCYPVKPVGDYWGLRWLGDHVADLTALKDAGRLTWDDSGMTHFSPFWNGRTKIYYQGGYTYVGSHWGRGTIFSLR